MLTSYGEGKGVIMTKYGGEVATATGRGEGRMTDSGKMKYPGAIFYAIHLKKSDRLVCLVLITC
jgi:hypothetical protein